MKTVHIIILIIILFITHLACSDPNPVLKDPMIDQSLTIDQATTKDLFVDQMQAILPDQQIQVDLDQMINLQDQATVITDLAFFDPNQTDLWLGDLQEMPVVLSENQLLEGHLWLKTNQLIAPKTIEEARSLGCALRGEYQGSGISNLESLGGIGFNFLVRGGLNAQSPLNIGLRLGPLASDQPVENVSGIDTTFGEFRWDENRVPYFTNAALNATGQSIENQWIDTPQGEITLPIRLFSAPEFDMKLSKASLSVRLFDQIKADGQVIKAKGVLMGYVYRSDLMAMVDQIKVQCLSDMPPSLCALFGSEIAKETAYLADVASTFLGGWELAMVNGEFVDCLRADQVAMLGDMGMGSDAGMGGDMGGGIVKCDMISFCLGVEMQAIDVRLD